jgi:hypothetical protein
MNKRLLLAAVVSFAAAPLFAAPARAQGTPAPGSNIGDKNLRDESDPTRARSNELERMKRDADKPVDKPAPAFPQIKEDFERIQIINSDVLQAGAPGSAPDYKRISEAASEIRKRAARLNSNLFPTEPGGRSKGKKPEAEEGQDLKSLLAAVDGAIISFVNNPIFQNTKVVNPEDSAKARRDLDLVIKLSAKLAQEAERLKQTGGG